MVEKTTLGKISSQNNDGILSQGLVGSCIRNTIDMQKQHDSTL